MIWTFDMLLCLLEQVFRTVGVQNAILYELVLQIRMLILLGVPALPLLGRNRLQLLHCWQTIFLVLQTNLESCFLSDVFD